MGRKFTRIKGENKPQNIVYLPLLGKIRLGIKKIAKVSGKEYPTEVDYFVCPPEVKAIYGEQPKELPVMLPTDNEEEVYQQFYACYGKNQKIKCIGNGETADRRIDGKDGKTTIQEMECPSPVACDFAKANKCAARMILRVVLPEINLGGIYQISTGAITSDIDIRSGIAWLRKLNPKEERISWIPMKLIREERKIPDPNTGNMNTHWPVKLYPTISINDINALRDGTNHVLAKKVYALGEPDVEGPQPDTPVVYVEDADVVGETPDKEEPETDFNHVWAEIKGAVSAAHLKSIWKSYFEIMKKLPPEQKASLNELKNRISANFKDAPPPLWGDKQSSGPGTPTGDVKKEPEAGKEKEKTTNYEFLQRVGNEKKRIGKVAYYTVLAMFRDKMGNFLYEHSNEILDVEDQDVFHHALEELPDLQKNPPSDCAGNPMSCAHSAYQDEDSPWFCGEFLCPFEGRDEEE